VWAFFALAYGLSWTSFYVLGGPVVFTLGPFLAALTMASALCIVLRVESEMKQSIVVRAGNERDIAAPATIAAKERR